MNEIKNILITNYYLNKYEGSQLLTFDIANYFKQAGVQVTVIGFFLDEPIISLFKNSGINIIDPIKTPSSIFRKEFDLIWGHHWPILGFALFELEVSCKYLIMGSLSPFSPIEAIWMLYEDAELIFFNSLENMNTYQNTKNSGQKYQVLTNSLPNKWFYNRKEKTKKITKVAIISNHVPPELVDAASILEKARIDIDLIGAEYSSKLVTPELIDQYDAIITIGHTVQKALVRNRMVYCYDRFGGPGWLNEKNIATAHEFNFSGRCCNRTLSSQDISNEILQGNDLIESTNINEKLLNSFSLESNISALLNSIEPSTSYKTFPKRKYHIESKICQSYINSNRDINLHIPPLSNISYNSAEIYIIKASKANLDSRIKLFRLDSEYYELLGYAESNHFLSVSGVLLIADEDVTLAKIFTELDGNVLFAKTGIKSPDVGHSFPKIKSSDSSRFHLRIPLTATKGKKLELFAKFNHSEIIQLATLQIS